MSNITELDKLWASFCNTDPKPWSSDEAKLDLNFIVSDSDKAHIASEVSGSVSEEFYKRPTDKQDPYIFYYMVLTLSNETIMTTVLKLKGKLDGNSIPV